MITLAGRHPAGASKSEYRVVASIRFDAFQKLPSCLIGIEACASSHHWSRELQALGHTVRLMPPAYVKPYVKRHKNDAADAEAICEAVTRANMRFVATKTPEQQSCLMLHRTRHLFIR
jgi:transposase